MTKGKFVSLLAAPPKKKKNSKRRPQKKKFRLGSPFAKRKAKSRKK
jgi:hypothetical protein